MPTLSSNRPHVLLVEGGTDLDLVDSFRDTFNKSVVDRQIPYNFEVLNMKGVEKLVDGIVTVLKTPRRRVVGILVDADGDATDRFEQIKYELEKRSGELGLTISLPDKPQPGGLIVDFPAKMPRVGVWIMPDNSSSGALEDFVVKMIRSDDKIWPLSEAYIDGIPLGFRKFPPRNPRKIIKAKVNAWLAAGEWPAPLHLAVKNGDLDINVACCKDFAAWLCDLYG